MSKASDILDNVSKVIVGKRNVSELVLTSIIAGGHVLLEDVPGTGKTMLTGLTFFVRAGGVEGKDCNPVIMIDNIRVVPIEIGRASCRERV